MIRLKIQMGMELLSFLNDPPKMVHRSTKGNWTNKERVEGSEVIGVHVNLEDNIETETNKATIIYSKTGSHIVPRKDEKK